MISKSPINNYFQWFVLSLIQGYVIEFDHGQHQLISKTI